MLLATLGSDMTAAQEAAPRFRTGPPASLRAQPAPQPQPQPESAVSIAAVVNEDIITQFDVQSRMSLIIATSGLENTPDVLRRLAPQVVDSLVDERLKLQEARRLKITVSENEIRQSVDSIEQRNNMRSGAFRQLLESKGVDMSTLYSQIEGDLLWAHVVRSSLEEKVNVGDDEVKAVLARAQANQGKPEYLVGEISLPVPTPQQEQTVRDLANRLVQQARGNAPFPALAQQFSQSPAAALGGDLGWVVRGDLEPELDDAVSRLAEGQISEPIRTSTGYHILTVRTKRIAGAPNPAMTIIVLSQIYLPTVGGRAFTPERVAELSTTISGFTTCEQMDKLGEELETPGTGRTMPIYLGGLPENVRNAVMDLKPGRTSAPIDAVSARLFVQVCLRREDKGVPAPDQITATLRDEKLQNVARQRLRDLRRQALIDVRI